MDVILELIEIVQGGKEENEENKEKEEENKETTEEKEEENGSNEEEKPKEEGENEDSGSGESDMESQEDTVNEIHHKFKINGPEEWQLTVKGFRLQNFLAGQVRHWNN